MIPEKAAELGDNEQALSFHLSEAIERHAELADRHIALQVEFAALHAAWTKAQARESILRVALSSAERFLDSVGQYGALRLDSDVPELFYALGVVRAALASTKPDEVGT